MSITIRQSDISDVQKQDIIKHLFLVPKSYNHIKGEYDYGEPITLYQPVGEKLVIPFAYGGVITGAYSGNDKYPRKSMADFEYKLQLYPKQIKVAEVALDILNKHRTVTLNLYTGFGKTQMFIYLSTILKKMTLILTHQDHLAKQIYNSLKDVVPESKIWYVGEDKKPPEHPDFILCMDGRFGYIPDNIRMNIGTLVVDEAHLMFTGSRLPIYLRVFPNYIILCTATKDRKDIFDDVMKLIAGDNVIEVKNPKSYTVYKYNTGIKVPIINRKIYNREMLDWDKTVKWLKDQDARNQLIMNKTKEMIDLGHKVIVVARLVEHVTHLFNMAKEIGLRCDWLAKTKRIYSDSQVLFGGIKKIGTGFDEKSLCDDFDGIRSDVLIICDTIKKMPTFIQLIGRVMRADNPIIIEIIDNHNVITNHFKEHMKYYKHSNAVVHVIGEPDPPAGQRGRKKAKNKDEEKQEQDQQKSVDDHVLSMLNALKS
ncbi:VV A18-like helicase [Orpheovirus IHUMI-LCC2]|uniref:VV A18-like helicase n=1 Tax=Orpheovirus IHUMI-LCC2 TaxID=2023057 RepID=A0A2I2L5U2_9VIRU|nr:VV A18-like helicase [Orpheovirus IHUMI-LCC2]SNW62903.1 VV A18-like helicase [Orpheovirus IHUMI-LCC2]